MFDCILLIAGKGERSGLSYNKVFYTINKKPLFRYSLETFLDIKECRKIVLVIREDDIDLVKKEIETLDNSRIEIVYGGNMRQDSVSNGIDKCESKVVLIHDGARPLVSKKNIDDVYINTLEYYSSVLAVKTIDTIKEVKDGKTRTLNRENLWNIQTPQGVNLEYYKISIKKAIKENYYATDDVSLLEKYMDTVPKIVEGSYQNIKATTYNDIEYIEYLIKEKKYGV